MSRVINEGPDEHYQRIWSKAACKNTQINVVAMTKIPIDSHWHNLAGVEMSFRVRVGKKREFPILADEFDSPCRTRVESEKRPQITFPDPGKYKGRATSDPLHQISEPSIH